MEGTKRKEKSRSVVLDFYIDLLTGPLYTNSLFLYPPSSVLSAAAGRYGGEKRSVKRLDIAWPEAH